MAIYLGPAPGAVAFFTLGGRPDCGPAARESECYIGRNPKTGRFEITFDAADDPHAQFLVEHFATLEAQGRPPQNSTTRRA